MVEKCTKIIAILSFGEKVRIFPFVRIKIDPPPSPIEME
jgi:hypothetical protein